MFKEQERIITEVVHDLCTFNPLLSSESTCLPHDCYMIFVGRLTNCEHLQKLTRTNDSTENFKQYAGATKSSFTMMETEEMEFF
ncbi:unnamed protein product [Rotaria sp. Silwood2]|nr:unnamed protein product [Rotaria sp. Silwood2]CAF4562202.1 unnamed protein product [Rotaria sp. Silwood2]